VGPHVIESMVAPKPGVKQIRAEMLGGAVTGFVCGFLFFIQERLPRRFPKQHLPERRAPNLGPLRFPGDCGRLLLSRYPASGHLPTNTRVQSYEVN